MKTKITELFGIEYPVILPGMSWISVAKNYTVALCQWLDRSEGHKCNAQAKFSELVAGRDYFLVSASNQLDAQPELKKILDGYTVAEQGNGFVLYDLHKLK